MANPHPGDLLSQDVLDYVETESDYAAKAILGSALAPKTATLTSAEKMRVIANLWWNPDGTPNTAGRDHLQAAYGKEEFLAITEALAKRHGQLHADAADVTLPEEA